MQFRKTRIAALAHVLPEEVLSSEEIELRLEALYGRLKLPSGRLEWMTGIQSRRMWPAGTRPSQASAWAGKKVLDQFVTRPPVDLLIHAAVSRDRLEPATAAYIHKELDLPDTVQIFDLSNACLGFLNAILVGGSMIEAGWIKTALIVAGENGRPLVEETLRTLLGGDFTRRSIRPYFANLTIGCGAVSCLLAADDFLEDTKVARLEHASIGTDGRFSNLCEGDQSVGNALVMQTDSEALLEAGIGLASLTWKRFLEEDPIRQEFNRIITHQVGKTHQNRLHQALSIDPGKDFCTYPYLGNVGSVACPITLSIAREEQAITKGDRVALLGIGSGLSSVMLSLSMEE